MSAMVAPASRHPVNLMDRRTSGRGQSDAAQALEQIGIQIESYLLRPYESRARLEAAFHKLDAAAQEAAYEGWDGYGATPVQAASYERAIAFLATLPATFPLPEVSVDHEGEVTLDWRFGWRRALTISLGGNGRLVFAWINGYSSQRGTDWLNDGVPRTIAGAFAALVDPEEGLRA